MSEQSTVLVVGATGSIGVHVVREALTRGRHVRALVRDASRAARVPEGAEIVIGDLTSAETLADAVAGIGSVVFVHGSHGGHGVAEKVDYGAVANVITVLDGRLVRIALMTAVGTTDRANEGHDWKRRAERLVRASGNRYTVVRPGWFDYNAPDERHIVQRSVGVIHRRRAGPVLAMTRVRSPTSARRSCGREKPPGTRRLSHTRMDFVWIDVPFAYNVLRNLGILDGAKPAKIREPQTGEQNGADVAAARGRAGLSQKELVAQMSERGFPWTQATVSQIEKGERPLRLSEADHLAELIRFRT
ncbi:NAD(P)H-binding protein [Microbacterium maritypicum]|uniref:NAD(P)H-binding protein n=1 Tax=Microbacterium maritypicum TaxID=33918 RepID=UPI0038223C31